MTDKGIEEVYIDSTSMKVNDPNINNVPPGTIGGPGLDKSQQSEQLRKGRASSRTDPSFGESPDQVALSDLGGRLRELNVDSAERTAQVKKLGEDIRAGRYEVDAMELSRRLIDDSMRSSL